MNNLEYIQQRIEEETEYKNPEMVPQLVEMAQDLSDAFGMERFEDILSVVKQSRLFLEATESVAEVEPLEEADEALKKNILSLLSKEKSLHNIGLDFDSLLHLTDSTESNLQNALNDLLKSKKIKETTEDNYKLV